MLRLLSQFTTLLAMSILLAGSSALHAQPPQYNLDRLEAHPYCFLPNYGHPSLNPGSPRYFVPGYGYRIPGFGYAGQNLPTLTDYSGYNTFGTFGGSGGIGLYSGYGAYNNNYQFGQRNPGGYGGVGNFGTRFGSNSYGGPWYFPGSATNTHSRWPSF